jgi:phage/plasmid-like protein (TIGR03299 family)
MAHELEQLADGTTAFATARVPAWHRLGTVTTGCMTAEQVITTARLGNWNVHKIPVVGIDPARPQERLEAPDKRMTVRTNPVTGALDYLGVVGRDYVPVQNEACAELLDLLVDASGAHHETAGSLRGGRNVFITMRLPDGVRIAGIDAVDIYLAVTTSHDGSASLRVDATPVRVVCANTQRLALRRSVGHYTFRHTTNIKTRIAQARQAVGIVFDYRDAFTAEAERMINQTFSETAFLQVCEQIWPTPPADAPLRTRNSHRRRTRTLDYLFTEAPTQQAIRGTVWGAWESIIEYLDHYTPAADADRRAERVLTSTTLAGIKQKAHDLLMPA